MEVLTLNDRIGPKLFLEFYCLSVNLLSLLSTVLCALVLKKRLNKMIRNKKESYKRKVISLYKETMNTLFMSYSYQK